MRDLPLTAILGAVVLTVSACANDGRLMNLRNAEAGPDEFAVLPTEPIEIPADLTALPTPAPDGANRADPDPEAAAIAALGGDADGGGRGADDLVGHAARFGVDEDIRTVLAAEDRAFRDGNRGRVLERALGVNVYFRAYRDMSLAPYAELERLRAAGAWTPAAPPPAAGLSGQ